MKSYKNQFGIAIIDAHIPLDNAPPPLYDKKILIKSNWFNWRGVLFTATLKLTEPSRITALNAVATEFTYKDALY